MKLCLVTLHLYVLSAWCVSLNTLDVSQTADIDVLEGEAVNISCCWTGMGNRVRVTWFKNQTLKDATVSNNVVQETQNNQVEKCSILNFGNITKQDSGRYVCQVNIELPVLTTASGNGTVITVKSRGNQNDTTEESPSSTNKPAMTILPVVLPLLLVSITFFLYLREPRNHALTTTVNYSPLQRQQRSADATCSPWRGSSQWESELHSLICYKRDETKGCG